MPNFNHIECVSIIQNLAQAGKECLAALKGRVTTDFKDVPELKVSEPSPHCLDVSFLGLRLQFRVELTIETSEATSGLKNSSGKGAIVAYSLSDEPKRKDGQEEVFDPLGVSYDFNTETKRDRIGVFLGDVFEKLFAQKRVVKP